MGASYKHTLETKYLAKNVWHQNGLQNKKYFQIYRSCSFSHHRNARSGRNAMRTKSDKERRIFRWLWVIRRSVRAGNGGESRLRVSKQLVRAGLPLPWSSEPASRWSSEPATVRSGPSRLVMVGVSQLVRGEPPDQSWAKALDWVSVLKQVTIAHLQLNFGSRTYWHVNHCSGHKRF